MKQISIKWKLFLFFTIFTAIIIGLLWLLQIVFLDDFYKHIKSNEAKAAAEIIASNFKSNNLSGLIEELSTEMEIDIAVLDMSGKPILWSIVRPRPTVGFFWLNPGHNTAYDTENKLYMRRGNLKYEKEVDGGKIIINSMITPVNATVSTLKIQLWYITVILLVIALVLAFILSRNISNPIEKINNSAKILATGDYGVAFNGNGFKEVSELSKTLNFATSELSKVDKLRQELIANISHDLRTPLTMITGYSEAMRDLPDENTPDNLQIVIDEAKRLTSLVNNVLDISKLQSGNMQLNLSDFNITTTIDEMINRYKTLTNMGADLGEYNFEFVYDREIIVYADEVQISQVLTNLINNAITHTGEDRLIRIIQTVKDGGKSVRIEVIDTGDGIDMDKLAYIWDRYYKVDKAHKRAMIGTGLGLSIVKSILKNHQAAVMDNSYDYGVESYKGRGSVFWFSLKISD